MYQRLTNSVSKRLRSQILLFGALILLFGFFNIASNGKLFESNNIRVVLSNSIFSILTGWGLTFIFSTGLIDLSIGANILLSANVGAFAAIKLGLGYPGLIIGSVSCAVSCVLLSTTCSVKLKIPSWISGLGVALVLEAILALWGTYLAANFSERLPILSAFRSFGQMPGMIYLLAAGFLIAYIAFNKTTLGINLQAVGGNADIAKTMGINVEKTIFFATIIGGIFVGFAAINNISFVGKMDASSGLNSLGLVFKALSAALLAESFRNIFTKPVGILLCGIFVTALFNILTIFGVPSGTWQNICLAIMIILTGILSNLNNKGVVK